MCGVDTVIQIPAKQLHPPLRCNIKWVDHYEGRDTSQSTGVEIWQASVVDWENKRSKAKGW